MKKIDFKNKKVLVMGLGLLGGGVAVTNWLIRQGARVRVTDLKTKAQLLPSLKKIKGKVELVLGQHREQDFKWADIVVQNPAVPRESKYLKIARKSGARIENEATIFFKFCPAKIVGVTGTRGKSTTATLIYRLLGGEALASLREPKGSLPLNSSVIWPFVRGGKVWLAGNIQKTPMLEILDKIKADDLVVLELSSWHLENLGEKKFSPHGAIITNIYPDHLNRYVGMKDYIATKKNIFRWQDKNDFVVLNKDNPEIRKMGREVKSRRFWFSKKHFAKENGVFVKSGWLVFCKDGRELKLIRQSEIALPGVHNLENILAALAVAEFFGLNADGVKKTIRNFRGLANRLELIKEIKGVKYYNDTTATMPEATIAALRTLGNRKNIILIAGGSDKGLAFDKLAKEIKKYCKVAILLRGLGADKIKKQLLITRYLLPVTEVNNMADAVGVAKSFARRGNIILLSPACASFGLFLNEFERGERFREAVEKLINGHK